MDQEKWAQDIAAQIKERRDKEHQKRQIDLADYKLKDGDAPRL